MHIAMFMFATALFNGGYKSISEYSYMHITSKSYVNVQTLQDFPFKTALVSSRIEAMNVNLLSYVLLVAVLLKVRPARP